MAAFHPLQTLDRPVELSTMLWWDWNTRQRLALLAVMFAIATIPWLVLSGLNEPGVILGGTAFLAIPQMIGWFLFVGLHTGRMPSAYGRSEKRDETPTWFWLTGAGYAAILLLYVCMVVGFLTVGQ